MKEVEKIILIKPKKALREQRRLRKFKKYVLHFNLKKHFAPSALKALRQLSPDLQTEDSSIMKNLLAGIPAQQSAGDNREEITIVESQSSPSFRDPDLDRLD